MSKFILHWGEMGPKWGVNRTVAQVHALLYLADEPLTAEEICETLLIARSNVSTSLRELLNWDLVQVEHRMGDRRDFYGTSHDVWVLFQTVVEQRIEREILPTLAMLRDCTAEARQEKLEAPHVVERIVGMQAFLEKLHGWYEQVKHLPPVTLQRLISSGVKLTGLLPAAPAKRDRRSAR